MGRVENREECVVMNGEIISDHRRKRVENGE
jgi:hypothetical protein